jgi:hypothetical protein
VIDLNDSHSAKAAIVGIQRGLQGMYEGTGEDAEHAFAALERELGIPERA